ncbi:MAG: CoA transferase [Chitinophagaceae bacterium]|nr:CoA transferase [Chitinophagaceae bacterium]
MLLPLKDIIVLEFSQYLAGPCAGLRLADLGARVIKIERPVTGEAGRKLAIKNLWADDSSLLFHTINRNKESFAIDLNNKEDLEWVKKLIAKAHVITHNFRPGVMERKGLSYDEVKKINPSIIYTEISGYTENGPWKNKPGQDLLLQSLSGLTYTTANQHDAPTPFGLAMGDYLCGNQAVQFIIAALIKARKTGKGSLLQLSLMESLIDFQFEFLTTCFQSGKIPSRSAVNNANPLLSAPYGIYKTADGYLAIAMMPLSELNKMLQSERLQIFREEEAFVKRDQIKKVIAEQLIQHTNQYWLQKSAALDLWIMPVLNWKEMEAAEGYKVLDMEQEIILNRNKSFLTTRCPIRINRKIIKSAKPAPVVGENNTEIKKSLV